MSESTANKSWSVIDDEELKLFRQLAAECSEIYLLPFCEDCNSRYTCEACSKIMEIRELADKLSKKNDK